MMRVACIGLLALLLVPPSVRLPDGGRAFQASRRRSTARIASVSSDGRLALETSQISARSRTPRPGELVVLSIELPAPTGRVRVRAFGRDVEAYREGDREWRALVGIDLDVKPGTYSVTADADGLAGSGPIHAAYDLVVTPHAFRTRRLTVNEAF